MPAIYWLAGALILALIELLTVDLTFLMLGLGAASAGIVALTLGPDHFYTQVLVFAAVSLLLLLVLRPWVRNYLSKSVPDFRSNAAGLSGSEALVVETVTDQVGLVKLEGSEWTARTSSGQIEPGTKVTVGKIDGATAWVEPKGE